MKHFPALLIRMMPGSGGVPALPNVILLLMVKPLPIWLIMPPQRRLPMLG